MAEKELQQGSECHGDYTDMRGGTLLGTFQNQKFSFHRKRFFNAEVLQLMVHNAQCLGGQWSHCRDWCWRPEGSPCGWWELGLVESRNILCPASFYFHKHYRLSFVGFLIVHLLSFFDKICLFLMPIFFAKSIERKTNKYITALPKALVFVVLYAHKDNFFALK